MEEWEAYETAVDLEQRKEGTHVFTVIQDPSHLTMENLLQAAPMVTEIFIFGVEGKDLWQVGRATTTIFPRIIFPVFQFACFDWSR
jgi:hypothetical protein